MGTRTTSGWHTLKGRVAAAFGALRKGGIYARGPVGFDQSEALEVVARPGDDRGFAYYHSQDAQRARGGGPLPVGFGSARARQTVAIGREVAAALEREGLHVQWDGSARTRLSVCLSRDAAERAAKAQVRAREEETERVARIEADRAEPTDFFAGLRAALEGLAAGGAFHVIFGERVEYLERQALAARHQKTIVVCPLEFPRSWDRLNIDVLTHPVEHDKTVVRQIAETLKKAGHAVAYVHGSYLHMRTTAGPAAELVHPRRSPRHRASSSRRIS